MGRSHAVMVTLSPPFGNGLILVQNTLVAITNPTFPFSSLPHGYGWGRGEGAPPVNIRTEFSHKILLFCAWVVACVIIPQN